MTFDQAHRAIKRGQLAALIQAIPHDLSPNEKYYKTGTSLLMMAATTGNVAIVGFLIEKGASLDDMDKSGWTALSSAAHHGHAPCIVVLLEAGATLIGRPMGWDMQMWLRKTTGLPQRKIEKIFDLLKNCVYLDPSNDTHH